MRDFIIAYIISFISGGAIGWYTKELMYKIKNKIP
jgi:hypothetical protein